MKKLTKREVLGMVRGVVEGADVDNKDVMLEVIDKEIASLIKKAEAPRKPTKNQVANEGIKDLIVETLKGLDKAATIAEVREANDELGQYNAQKISALLTQLKKDGKVERTEEKGKAYFKAN